MLDLFSSGRSYRHKILQAVLASSCIVLFLCYFTPIDIFFNNKDDFNYTFYDISFYLLLISALLITLLSSILIAIPKRGYDVLVSLALVITLLLWVQGNIFFKDYGSLDGGQVDWSNWKTRGYVEIGIWAITITLAIFLRQKIIRIANKICLLILLTFFASFLIEFIKYSPSGTGEVIFDESVKFDFSSKENVILILVDTAQSDTFYEILSKNPKLKEEFSGFVYYPDTIAGFSQTITSVPNILTGAFYDNSVPFPKYIENSYLGPSIPKMLKERGYRVDLIPTYYDHTIYKSRDVATNLVLKDRFSSFQEGLSNAINLIDVSLFRNVPQTLKKYVINDDKWLFSRLLPTHKFSHLDPRAGDENFYSDISNINDSVGAPVFKFFHLKGCHGLYNKDETGKTVRHKASRDAYKSFCTYSLKRLASFLSELKSKGIYDKSLIYIFGDHGEGRFEELKINTSLVENKSEPGRTAIPIKIKSRAIPLLMIKDFFSTGELKISSKPMYLAEMPQMIFEKLNIYVDNVGEELSENENNLPDTRKYYYYNWPTVDPLFEYDISGHGWFDSSWDGPEKIYTKNGVYEKYFTVLFEDYSSEKYTIDSYGSVDNYVFKSSHAGDAGDVVGKGHFTIDIIEPDPGSKYFLTIDTTNHKLKKGSLIIDVNGKRVDKVNIKQSSHIDDNPITGVRIPEIRPDIDEIQIKISYSIDDSSLIDNPIEAIHVFKLQEG